MNSYNIIINYYSKKPNTYIYNMETRDKKENENEERKKQIKAEQEDEAQQYIQQMSERQLKAYQIAQNHLKTSFNILLSNGFKEWKKNTKK